MCADVYEFQGFTFFKKSLKTLWMVQKVSQNPKNEKSYENVSDHKINNPISFKQL